MALDACGGAARRFVDTLTAVHNGASFFARAQPALSLCGNVIQNMPRGEAASLLYALDTVLPQVASAWPLITASADCFQPGTTTLVTSSQVRPANAR